MKKHSRASATPKPVTSKPSTPTAPPPGAPADPVAAASDARERESALRVDVLVARATCRDGQPFAAFGPLLESLLARVPQATRKAVSPVLAAILPELGDEAPALEPRAARSRLFAAIADLVEAATTPPGLLVCLDDWHAADPASRDLLDFLGRTLPPLPLCIVLASRQAPGEGDDAIALGGLNRREAGALWRGLWDGKEPGGGFMTALEERTGGNPALVEQTALHCRPLMNTGRGGGAQAAVVQATLPATLQAFWRTRLLALPQPARTLAQAAAVAGAHAGLALLQGVAELEEETFFEALELLGVQDSQVEAVSFGKEKPAVDGHDEAAWAKNRRAEIAYRR